MYAYCTVEKLPKLPLTNCQSLKFFTALFIYVKHGLYRYDRFCITDFPKTMTYVIQRRNRSNHE